MGFVESFSGRARESHQYMGEVLWPWCPLISWLTHGLLVVVVAVVVLLVRVVLVDVVALIFVVTMLVAVF